MARKTVDTAMFQFAHGRKPRGQAFWAFENLATGDQACFNNTLYSEAVKKLPAGSWKALP